MTNNELAKLLIDDFGGGENIIEVIKTKARSTLMKLGPVKELWVWLKETKSK